MRGFFRSTLSGKGWSVGTRILHWPSGPVAETGYLFVMKTDVILDNPAKQRRIVIEAKFIDGLVSGLATGKSPPSVADISTSSTHTSPPRPVSAIPSPMPRRAS